MYQLTIYSENGRVVDVTFHDEPPKTPTLEPGQWIDICRLLISDATILEHLLEEHDLVCST